MSLYNDLNEVLTPYANKIKEVNESLDNKADVTGIAEISEDTVGYMQSSGLNPNASWHCLYTDKIKCEPGWTYHYVGVMYNAIPARVLFYLNGVFVSAKNDKTGGIDEVITIPDGVNQVVFQSASITANTISLYVERTYPYSFETINIRINSLSDKIDNKADYDSKIEISELTPGRMSRDRTISDTSAWHCIYTNIIDVKPGWKFKYIGGTYNSGKASCIFYYLDGTFVSSQNTAIGEEVEVTIPNGVNQVWFQAATAASLALAMTVKQTYPITLTDVLESIEPIIAKSQELVDGTLLPKYKVLPGESYGYLGRWYDYTYNNQQVKVASSAGSEVCFKVSGASSITINWTGDNVTEHVYYCYMIDDGEKVRKNLTQNTITLPDTDEHIVRIICDSIPHTASVNCWTPGYGFVFGGIDAGNGSTKGIVPTNKTIMYFGDSITEGVRAYGSESGTQTESDVDSACESYGFYASKYLNCSSVIVGYGSTGLAADGYFKKCIDALNYVTNGIETEDVSPDLIVINHGHNDTGTASEAWITAFNKVISRFMTKYPGVEVVALSPFNGRHASDMETACEDLPHCYYVDTSTWGLSQYYADGPGHLTSAGAVVCGTKLAQSIKKLGLI